MSHKQLGETAQAKDCFDKAERWLRKQQNLPPQWIKELKALRAEAQECLEFAPKR